MTFHYAISGDPSTKLTVIAERVQDQTIIESWTTNSYIQEVFSWSQYSFKFTPSDSQVRVSSLKFFTSSF